MNSSNYKYDTDESPEAHWNRHLKANGIGPKEAKAYRMTLKGAKAYCMFHEYNMDKCKKEMDICNKKCREDNKCFYENAFLEAQSKYPTEPVEFHRIVAENKCVEELYIPPGWTKMLHCKSCGSMPCKEGEEGDHVACPWCSSLRDDCKSVAS